MQYIREIIIAFLFTSLLGLGYTVKSQSAQINLLEGNLSTCKETNDDLSEKLKVVDQAVKDADKAFTASEVKRKEIVDILTEQVNILKKQNVPKECKAAVQWAKDNKGDLSWSNK